MEGYKCQILAESLSIITNVTPDSNIGWLESRGLQRQSSDAKKVARLTTEKLIHKLALHIQLEVKPIDALNRSRELRDS